MKSIKDLQAMINEPCEPFINKYTWFLSYLEDSYLSKTDGVARIKCSLDEWDEETREHIVNVLSDMLLESGLENFDPVGFKKKMLS